MVVSDLNQISYDYARLTLNIVGEIQEMSAAGKFLKVGGRGIKSTQCMGHLKSKEIMNLVFC